MNWKRWPGRGAQVARVGALLGLLVLHSAHAAAQDAAADAHEDGGWSSEDAAASDASAAVFANDAGAAATAETSRDEANSGAPDVDAVSGRA